MFNILPESCSVGIILQQTSTPTLSILSIACSTSSHSDHPRSNTEWRVELKHQFPGVASIGEVLATRAVEGIHDLLGVRQDGSMFLLLPGGEMNVEIEKGQRLNGNGNGTSGEQRNGRGRLEDGGDMSVSHWLAPVLHESRPHSSTSQFTTFSPSRIIDVAGSSLTLVSSPASPSSSKLNSIRISANFSPSSPLVRSSFLILSHLISTTLLHSLRTRFLRTWYTLYNLGGTEAEQWECFERAVLGATSGDPPSPGHWAIVPPLRSNWLKMGGHWTSENRRDDPALRYLRHPPSSSASLNPGFGSSAGGAGGGMGKMAPRQHPELEQLLHALHLLAEEVKMDGARRESGELRLIAGLLVKLGVGVGEDWVEYWLRACPELGTGWEIESSS